MKGRSYTLVIQDDLAEETPKERLTRLVNEKIDDVSRDIESDLERIAEGNRSFWRYWDGLPWWKRVWIRVTSVFKRNA